MVNCSCWLVMLRIPPVTLPTGFDHLDKHILFVTNQREGAAELAKISLDGVIATSFMSADKLLGYYPVCTKS